MAEEGAGEEEKRARATGEGEGPPSTADNDMAWNKPDRGATVPRERGGGRDGGEGRRGALPHLLSYFFFKNFRGHHANWDHS